MQKLGDSPIHADIVLCILCALPTFETLFAAIRTSKVFYSAFYQHKKQILNAVAFNHVGPALPLALQLVRHDFHISTGNSVTHVLNDETRSYWDFQVTSEDIDPLVNHAKVVAEWEDLFSFRKKNMRHKTSQLTLVESWQFRRAMYRLMLYSRLFPTDKSAYGIIGNKSTSVTTKAEQERLVRTKFLADCFTNELDQFRQVATFVAEIIGWVDMVDSADMITYQSDSGKDFTDIALSVGPAVVLECYKTLGFEPLTETINKLCANTTSEYFEDDSPRPLLSGYLFNIISQVLRTREADNHRYISATIIDDSLAQEFCSQCGNQSFVGELWGKTTWDFLSLPSSILGTYLFPSLNNLLKGELSRNPVEVEHVEALLVKTPFKEIYEDIYAKNLKLPEWHDRNDDYWMCQMCLLRFIRDHLHLWAIMKRKEANQPIANDCWYGYNCRTQVHKLQHAKQLNHLCEPTR